MLGSVTRGASGPNIPHICYAIFSITRSSLRVVMLNIAYQVYADYHEEHQGLQHLLHLQRAIRMRVFSYTYLVHVQRAVGADSREKSAEGPRVTRRGPG